MYKINAIGSSSRGNCFVVSDGISTILLDCGMPADSLKLGLFDLNINLSDINGILITHDHQDHIAGINALKSCKKYMTKGTYEENQYKNSLKADEVVIIKKQKTYKIGTFEIKAFASKHDAAEPVGFIVKNHSNEKLYYLTDSGIANVNLKNAEVYIIESNHSEKFLRLDYENGNLSKERYERVSQTHLSSEKAIAYLKKNMGDKTKQIILMHLSPRNKKPIGVMNFVRKQLNTDIVDFVHPINHKVKKTWEVGYKPKRERKF